ncbi:MAG TPA: hypothetical protein VMW56_29735 [Candidatus Margulisiibacteriota bacterium]|nr:hypothetical protein [Candidatus Margulisiibacteriota bacterium]
MRKRWGTGLLVAVAACLWAPAAFAGSTKCTLKFDLHEWAAFYESATGSGKITCDNGQSANVTIRSKGGGLSVGKFKISDGRGSFTDVSSIDELFGKYMAADTEAGARKAADAWVMFKDKDKNKVSLAVAGTGEGWELGFSVDEFIITKAK